MRPCTIEMQGFWVPVIHNGSLLHAAGGLGVPETAVSHVCECICSSKAQMYCSEPVPQPLNPKLAHTWPAWLLLPVQPDAALTGLTRLRLTWGQRGRLEGGSKVRLSTSSEIRGRKHERWDFSLSLSSFCQTFTKLLICASGQSHFAEADVRS